MIKRAPLFPAMMGEQDRDSACPVCGEQRRGYLFVTHGLPVARCAGCDLLVLHPRPQGSEIMTYYRAHSKQQDPRLFASDSVTERDAASRYVKALNDRGVRGGRLLLIAPPAHLFADVARAASFEVAKHLSIIDAEATDLGGPYDAIVILYQIEKAHAPDSLLSSVQQALSPEGVLLLACPSTESWPAHFFGAHWTEWRPENRYYFNPNTIQAMLMKTGFGQVWMEPDRRLYTLRHIRDRAVQYPRTRTTRFIRFVYRLTPNALRDRRIRLATSGMVITCRRNETARPRPLVSIVLPAYNEKQTFCTVMDTLLAKQLVGADKEIIVVESNSTDGTREAVLQYRDHPEVKVVLQERPCGKGNAVRQGFLHARGDIILIQDADLEYDFNDYDALLEPLLAHKSVFVLGSRHGGSWKMRQFKEQRSLATVLNFGHVFFTGLINVLYGQKMTDPFTMYKLFHRECLYGLNFECNRFDFDHELVIKLCRKGYRPLEIPVNYWSRSFAEGKKVTLFRDPLTWLWVDVKNRIVRLSPKFDS